MCSGSEAGSYFRLIDFVYHSTLGLRVIKKKRRALSQQGALEHPRRQLTAEDRISKHLQFINLVQGNLLHRTTFISNIKANVK